MSYLGKTQLKSSDIQRFDITSSTSATHVLSWTAPNEQSLIITINGVKQQDDAYSIAGSPTTVTLTDALVATDKLEIVGIVDVGTMNVPGVGSVQTDQLADDAVTADKLAAGLANATHTGDVTGATALTIATDAVDIAMLSATGTASSSTFLRGDNSWQTAGVSTLAALTDATISSSNPAIDTNPSAVGHLWLNSTSGEGYIATQVTTGENIWTNIGSGSGDVGVYDIDFLVIAGGGGGGRGNYGRCGGGGAGGYRASWNDEASGGGGSSEAAFDGILGRVYTVTIGAGGAGSASTSEGGTSGVASSIAATGMTTISTVGGGGAGSQTVTIVGSSGGSGGGGGGESQSGGAGTSNQGYAGGSSNTGFNGGGGGGSGAVGTQGSGDVGGNGGAGVTSTINGSSVPRAGGGGSGADTTGGSGGTGGGGAGGANVHGSDGTANTGSGGGGAGQSGGDGGSGVVIVRMLTASYSGTQSNGTVTTSGTDTIITFNSSGSFTG